jgi:hypothetical protein
MYHGDQLSIVSTAYYEAILLELQVANKTLYVWLLRVCAILGIMFGLIDLTRFVADRYTDTRDLQLMMILSIWSCCRLPLPHSGKHTHYTTRCANSYYTKRFLLQAASSIMSAGLAFHSMRWKLAPVIFILAWVLDAEYLKHGVCDVASPVQSAFTRLCLQTIMISVGMAAMYLSAFLYTSPHSLWFWFWAVGYTTGRHMVRICLLRVSRYATMNTQTFVLYLCISLDVPILIASFSQSNIVHVIAMMTSVCAIDALFGITTLFSDQNTFMCNKMWLIVVCCIVAPAAPTLDTPQQASLDIAIPRLHIGIISIVLSAMFPCVVDILLVTLDRYLPRSENTIVYNPLCRFDEINRNSANTHGLDDMNAPEPMLRFGFWWTTTKKQHRMKTIPHCSFAIINATVNALCGVWAVAFCMRT